MSISQVNIHLNNSTPLDAYLEIVGKVSFNLTPQQLKVIKALVTIDPTNPSKDRAKASQLAGVGKIVTFNNVFVALKKKGVIIPGDKQKYTYAPGVVPSEDISEIRFKIIRNDGQQEGNN